MSSYHCFVVMVRNVCDGDVVVVVVVVLVVSLTPAFLLADVKQCIRCHPSETTDFQNSALSRSVSSTASQPAGKLSHHESGSTIIIQRDGQGNMVQQVHAHGLQAEYPIAYAIGPARLD